MEATVNASFTLPLQMNRELKEIAKTEGRTASAQARIFLGKSIAAHKKAASTKRTR